VRKWLLACVGLAAAAAVALLLAEQRAELIKPMPLPAVTEVAPEAPSPAPALPEPAPPQQEDAPPQQEAALPPSQPTLPPLPEQDISVQPVHPVPDYRTAPVPHVTMEDRNGNPIGRSAAAPAPPAPATAPSAPAPSPRPQQAPPPVPATLTGPAQATGTTMLALQGHSVRLFGIAAPASGDRCRPGTGEPRPCTEVTQRMLADRLAHSANVTCALPPGASAGTPARICLDDKGVDIAGFLVGEGLALDDPRQTQDYRSAEGVARSLKKGLWAYR